ncbi:MAG: tetratricopeptide repeat protein [Thermoanaerobaculia bacterium]|nr:tetratricopeptide repeat protein [Thermoanaerobaculia bacterium]MCZ7652804.1 tetratricopeptide repeat protein [Thermoanaerobaculia bacterium]
MAKTWAGFALTGLILGASAGWAGWDEGLAAFKAKNYTQAVREFEGVVAERPEWPQGYLMLGTALLRADRTAQAIEALRKAYDLAPSDTGAQLTLAQAFVAAGRHGDAAQLLGKVNQSALSKEQQAAFSKLYTASLQQSGQGAKAQAELEKAARANPNDSGIQYQFGVAALNSGNTAQAVQALERAARLDAKSAPKQKALTQALIRQAQETGGSANDAIYARGVEAARALLAVEDNYDNRLLLGETQLGAKQYGAAAETFAQAAKSNSADWLPLFYQGQALTAAGNYEQAANVLRSALGRGPGGRDQARIHNQLGFVFEKQKKLNEAVAEYRAAGNNGAADRVAKNAEIAKHNEQAAAEEAKAKELAEQARKLREELAKQPGGAAPPPR